MPHEMVMKLLAALGFSPEHLAGEESASKLTLVIVGSIHFLVGCWTEALSLLILTQEASP